MRDYLIKLLQSGILKPEQRIKALAMLTRLKNRCPRCGASELSFCHHPKEAAARKTQSI